MKIQCCAFCRLIRRRKSPKKRETNDQSSHTALLLAFYPKCNYSKDTKNQQTTKEVKLGKDAPESNQDKKLLMSTLNDKL